MSQTTETKGNSTHENSNGTPSAVVIVLIGAAFVAMVIIGIIIFSQPKPHLPIEISFSRPEVCAQRILTAIAAWEENPLGIAREHFGSNIQTASFSPFYEELREGQAGFNYWLDNDSIELELKIDPRYLPSNFENEVMEIFVIKEGSYVGYLSEYIALAGAYNRANGNVVTIPDAESFINVYNNNRDDRPNELVFILDLAGHACSIAVAANMAAENPAFGDWLEHNLFILQGNPYTFSQVITEMESHRFIGRDQNGIYQLLANPADPAMIELIGILIWGQEDIGLTEFLGQ